MSTLPTHLQKISVLGAGESGISAAFLLASEGRAVTVHDTAPPEQLAERAAKLSAARINLLKGAEAVAVPEGTQLAVLSPGIEPGSPLVEAFRRMSVPVVGELELAYERCKCPVVAVTGTNGKTTTTQLIEAMFKGAGVATEACGNIGPAFSAKVAQSEALSAMTVEVSSFQLETIERFHPKIAVWLNFAPDHLDRYASMSEYYAAKLRIFEQQTENDWAVVNARDALPKLKARTLRFNAQAPDADFRLENGVIQFLGEPVLRMSDTHLVGQHNAENLMAALATGFAWGLDWAAMRPGLCAYRALPHRCEVVGESLGVQYVNDSKATNLDAVEKALASETRKVVLIAGGKDKGFGFESLTALVAQRCRSAVLIGEMAARISEQWSGALECQRAGSLSEAVSLARAAAQPGDVVLFSPGTSSFDMFANYADRGNQFRALVRQFSP
ncbi:MAG: UDP-N-acetylmuramoyl-L-alanine--D-glutamate ligase [Verrucomicrobia bacterium]|nr:UDP-N-acetylmuramoyl-L-alanine--D-glutamate ligase [Verrucomicrobiota bacterium]